MYCLFYWLELMIIKHGIFIVFDELTFKVCLVYYYLVEVKITNDDRHDGRILLENVVLIIP